MSARAMANFGLTDLRLVAPREGKPGSGAAWEGADAAAAGAVHILDTAALFPTVEDAILDLNFVWATTARERGQQKPIATPTEAMPECAHKIANGERHGVLFGPERTGLSNDEVALSNAIVTFPVNPAYASLNLAQAVLLVGYEWMRAATGGKPPFSMVQRSRPAPREMALSFIDYLEAELERAGFFRPASKQPVMRRNLRNMFHRMQLTEQDLGTLRGMVVRLVNGPRANAAGRKTPRTRKAGSFSATAKPDAQDAK
jgi:tRNA/rRNA methyltransferase